MHLKMLSLCYKSEPLNLSDFKIWSIEELNNWDLGWYWL